jgi:phosphohistidine phosphatase
MTDRTLVLLRHAKAEQRPGTADTDRPLTARGYDDAAAAGAWLAAQRLVPDLVICSPARRARQTWRAAATALGGDVTAKPAVYEPRVYRAATAEELLEVVAATQPEVAVLLLIGHNPALSQLSGLLDPATGTDGLRTSGIAVHRVPGGWSECTPGTAPVRVAHTARA